MSSPARRHKHYIAAQQSASLDEAASLSHLGNYDLLLFKMQQDLARLSGVESHETKAELKRGMLPTYMPWVAGVLQSDAGRQDAILMRVLVWFLDIGNLEYALDIGEYAIRHDLVAPDGFDRSTSCLLAEEIAAAAQRDLSAGRPLNTAQLQRAHQLLTNQDMPDRVKARLFKFVGYALRQDGDAVLALDMLKKALLKDENSGVKTDIKQLEKAIQAGS
ncbi:TPA: phage terminase small subunit [Serratia marcescens]